METANAFNEVDAPAGTSEETLTKPQKETEAPLNETPLKTKQKIVNMECPLEAFRTISRHADLDYIDRLGKLLTNVSDIMR